jgi:membrane protein DedA with SNARE-associated domain
LWAREQIVRRLGSAVLLARVVPGLRLATYTASGFVRVPFVPFTLWVLLAVALPIIVLALAVPLWRHERHWRQRRNAVAPKATTPS